jgi:ABC-type branched-subunit amino acid transport system substrate-binding protein
MQGRRRRYVAALVGLGLIGAACGGDDGGGGSEAETISSVDRGIKGALETTSTTGEGTATTVAEEPASMEEWEELWATERAAIVKRIKDEGWGKSADGKTLTGPGGWTVDLTKCIAGWSDTQGIENGTIKISQALALSGTYADYGNLGRAIQVMFNYYNDKGLLKDGEGNPLTVDYQMSDDGYDPARTIPLVDEFLDSVKPLMVWTLGSPSTLKTYEKVNQYCVPQLSAMTAHDAWGDPVNNPWTTGAPRPTYSTEATLWGTFIEQRLDEFPTDRKIKVAALIQNNDFGKLYEAAFKEFLAGSDLLRDRVEFISDRIEAQAPTVIDPMTTLAAAEPDVWISMLAGVQCTQIVVEAANNGMKEAVKYKFMPQTCPGAGAIGKDKLGGDGSAGDGWWIMNPGVKDLKDTALKDDPYILWLRDELQKAGIDPDSSTQLGDGINYGFPVLQAMAIASELEGGLTRTNLVLAYRSIDMTSPMLRPGMRLHMDGLNDAYIAESALFGQWDAAQQTYVDRSEVFNLDGKTKLCHWDQATSSCT